ncbi:MAG: metalloregulator ArsR/SmtB family transcription factor [Candidatus Zixiibacteriota bacterium]
MISTDDICQVKFVNQSTVNRLRKSLKDPQTIDGLAEIFSVLADPTRLKICIFLAQEELCVCDLAAMLNISESAISHQLRLLRSLRLVKYRRDGKMAFYALDDAHVSALIKQGMDHAEEKSKQ